MDPLASPAPVSPPQTIVLQPRESLFGRFGKLLLIALGLCVLTIMGLSASYRQYFGDGEGPTEKHYSLSREATQKIAVLKVSGAIMEADDFVEQQLEKIEKDPNVVAIVMRVDSPGGTVTYSHRLYHKTRALLAARKLPLVVSMGSLCASGGYYLAMAVGDEPDTIYAEPTTWTGSIGVVIPLYNFSRLMGVTGVQDQSIASGDLKLMGSPTRRMEEREQQVLQTLVDESYERFKGIVAAGRPALRDDPEALAAVATGQIFSADQAKERGLVDRIGFLEDAIERAAELAGVSLDDVRAVEYGKKVSPVEQLLGAVTPVPSGEAHGPDLRGFIELAAPRAYYLSTLAPVLLAPR
ncbi:signal peptide peptidase SppA [Botrimarina hoheduenensis]|uniref:Putative signal peptide peptidase SppA n=1 Tax=Botrimarina hoheduenensis TaxID=2528000 RepID=A0A5C5W7H3_9BACT|nr:signal peptide peptidase SppA [Botrimarina hoheduenensis]TWT46554.1 putative signal peptide peptidase SppA [Botrimarina hoheduenensis]